MMNLLKSFGPGAKQFVTEHKHWLLIAGLGALVFGGGMAAGRFLTPPNTVTVEKTVVKYQDKIVVQTQVQTKVVYVKAKQQEAKTHTVTTVVEGPGGTKTTTITKDTDTATKTQTNTNTDTSKNQVATEIKYVDRTVERVVTVTATKPQWRLGADIGLSVPYYISGQEIGTPGLKGVVIQVQAGRRLIGPLFMSVFGNTQGTVGVGLSGEF